MRYLKNFPIELVFWVLALVLLAATDPHAHHFTLCPLANLGLTWCPGCGFGRSITSLFHGDLSASLAYHWFGIPGILFIIYRIFQLAKQLLNTQINLKTRRTSNV